MVCVLCVVWPILLLVWYKFVHPFILRFLNSEKALNDKINQASESGENENNINKCYSDEMNREQLSRTETLKKDE